MRTHIQLLRDAGKRVIAFTQTCDLGTYLLASACDQIVMQPGGDVAVLGFYQQAVFLKESLDTIGISLDVIAITPYKGVYDQFSRDSLSPEGREQLERLLDSRYEIAVNLIAEGRKRTPEEIRTLIDTAPHLDTDALRLGWIDALLYEEGLPGYLETDGLIDWEEAEHKLIRKPQPQRPDQYVAILPITGLMLPGESGGSPVPLPIPIPIIGDERAGDMTIVQEVRALMKDEQAAAVVLFIDSGGGAVIAAEAMASALDELAKTRPVVAYMNGVAASGGYMVACPARWIVAQPGTITGSIGVVMAKPVTGGLESKLLVKTFGFQRGANADLYDTSKPFSDSQRAQMRASIEHNYRQFIERVAKARKLTVEAVDAVGGGRVWTGVQAIELKLIDQLGDLKAAVAKARELANLPDEAAAYLFEPHKLDPLPPLAAPVEKLDPAAGLRHTIKNARGLLNGRAQVILPFHLDKRL